MISLMLYCGTLANRWSVRTKYCLETKWCVETNWCVYIKCVQGPFIFEGRLAFWMVSAGMIALVGRLDLPRFLDGLNSKMILRTSAPKTYFCYSITINGSSLTQFLEFKNPHIWKLFFFLSFPNSPPVTLTKSTLQSRYSFGPSAWPRNFGACRMPRWMGCRDGRDGEAEMMSLPLRSHSQKLHHCQEKETGLK
jgi:hypothetical protein